MSKRKFREPDAATRAKMSAQKAGCKNPIYGQTRSADTKKAISEALKAYWAMVPSRNNNVNTTVA